LNLEKVNLKDSIPEVYYGAKKDVENHKSFHI